MHNPRRDPKTITALSIGEHATNLGAKKLGESLQKCLSEIALVESLPPGHPQGTMVLGLLKTNLRKIMGLDAPGEDQS